MAAVLLLFIFLSETYIHFFMSVCVFDDVMSHYVILSQQSDCDQSDKKKINVLDCNVFKGTNTLKTTV